MGAHDTVVVDPSGLDEGSQRSSAYDLALIAREAMHLPAFRAAIVKRDAVFPGGKDKQGKVWKPFHVYNINKLLRHYPGAIGIKPGRTDRAQHTFIGAATRGGRTLVVAQMGSITGAWQPTAALLDWGFAHADDVTPVGILVAPGEAPPPVAMPSLHKPRGALRPPRQRRQGRAPGWAASALPQVDPRVTRRRTPGPHAAGPSVEGPRGPATDEWAPQCIGPPGARRRLGGVGLLATAGAVLLRPPPPFDADASRKAPP